MSILDVRPEKIYINKIRRESIMKKVLLTLSLLLILTSSVFAGPCTNIIWGVITDNGNPVEGVTVVFQEVRMATVIDKGVTDKSGIYIILSRGNLSGNYSIAVDLGHYNSTNYRQTTGTIGTTISVIPNRAMRQDLDINTFKSNKITKATEDAIVYVTETGADYHQYGCQYLGESCIPVPWALANYWKLLPCSVCKP